MGRVIKFRGRIMNKFNSAGGGDQMQIRLIPGAIEQFRENSREGGREIYIYVDGPLASGFLLRCNRVYSPARVRGIGR